MKNIGKLNSEQFALAMYLVQQKVKGVDPPAQLTLEMVPPSMRPQQPAESTSFGVGVSTCKYSYHLTCEICCVKNGRVKMGKKYQSFLSMYFLKFG